MGADVQRLDFFCTTCGTHAENIPNPANPYGGFDYGCAVCGADADVVEKQSLMRTGTKKMSQPQSIKDVKLP